MQRIGVLLGRCAERIVDKIAPEFCFGLIAVQYSEHCQIIVDIRASIKHVMLCLINFIPSLSIITHCHKSRIITPNVYVTLLE